MSIAPVFALAIAIIAQLPGQAAYIEAWHAESEGHFKTAFDGYRNAAAAGGPLARFAAVRTAITLEKSGAIKDAEAALRAIVDSEVRDAATRMAEAELAKMLFEQNRYADAQPFFDAMLNVPVQPWWFNDYAWAAHENMTHLSDRQVEGYKYFEDVVRNSIYRAQRRDAARMLARSPLIEFKLLGVMGLTRADGEKEAEAILANLAAQGGAGAAMQQYTGALLALAAGADSPNIANLPEVPGAAWWLQAMALKGQRVSYGGSLDEAKAIVDALVAADPTSSETADALWYYARGCQRANRNSEAVQTFRRLADLNPGSRRADDALYAAAEILRDSGSAEAVGAFGAVADRYPDSRVASEALYEAAELLDKAGKRGDLVAVLERASMGPVGHYHVHRAAEWLYEIRGAGEDDRIAVPTGAVLPLVRPVVMPQANHEPLPPYITDDPRYQRLQFFGKTGLPEGEWEALDLAASKLGGPWPASLHRVLAETGFAHTSTEYLVLAEQSDDDAAKADRMRIHFARVHWDHIRSLGAEAGVDPYLVLAVGRQESTFRPALTSYAGASGLMQVMPSTAKWMADVDPNISHADASRLEHPEHSLRLGTFYLRRMLSMWDGNVVYALASYNAGPGNVKKWVNSFGHKPIDEFVESIPFDETRDYVKRVLGNYAAYYSLYVEGDEVLAQRGVGNEVASAG